MNGEFIHIFDKQTKTIYEFVPRMRVYKNGKEEMIFFKRYDDIKKRFRDVKLKDYKEKK